MADIISNKFLTLLGEKGINLETDVLKVALMTSSYTPDKDTDTWINTYEVSGTGYTAGGATLAGSTVTQDNVNDRMVWSATDVSWPSSTITARYAVVYDTTVSNVIIAVIDFGSDKSSTSGTFTLNWNATGVLILSQT